MKSSANKLPNKNAKVAAASVTNHAERSRAATAKTPDEATKQEGNLTKPLQKDAVRKAAAAEQTKLQNDPDSLPTAGFPNKRDPVSATKNREDPVLPKTVIPKAPHGKRG
jgi:hypothetical protein